MSGSSSLPLVRHRGRSATQVSRQLSQMVSHHCSAFQGNPHHAPSSPPAVKESCRWEPVAIAKCEFEHKISWRVNQTKPHVVENFKLPITPPQTSAEMIALAAVRRPVGQNRRRIARFSDPRGSGSRLIGKPRTAMSRAKSPSPSLHPYVGAGFRRPISSKKPLHRLWRVAAPCGDGHDLEVSPPVGLKARTVAAFPCGRARTHVAPESSARLCFATQVGR